MKQLGKYPNYRVYSDGRVQNRTTKFFLTQHTHPKGYKQVSLLDKNGLWHNEYVHRLVANTFKSTSIVSTKERKVCVSHLNKNRAENNKDNVYHIQAYKGYYTENTKQAVIQSRKRVYTWNHPEFGEFTGSLSELVREFPEQCLKQPTLSNILRGVDSRGHSIVHHKGWHLKGSCPSIRFYRVKAFWMSCWK